MLCEVRAKDCRSRTEAGGMASWRMEVPAAREKKGGGNEDSTQLAHRPLALGRPQPASRSPAVSARARGAAPLQPAVAGAAPAAPHPHSYSMICRAARAVGRRRVVPTDHLCSTHHFSFPNSIAAISSAQKFVEVRWRRRTPEGLGGAPWWSVTSC